MREKLRCKKHAILQKMCVKYVKAPKITENVENLSGKHVTPQTKFYNWVKLVLYAAVIKRSGAYKFNATLQVTYG